MQSALLQSKRYTRYLGRLYRGRGSRAAQSLRLRYGIALLAVALAWLATALLRVVSPERSLSLVFFFAAVAFGAGFGGLGPGVFATLLSALICDYFFLPP